MAIGKRPFVDATIFQAFTSSKQQSNKCNQNEAKRNLGEVEPCTFCGKDGHSRDGCFKRIGYLDWWPGKGTKRERQRPRAACIEAENTTIPMLTEEQYKQFLNLFSSGEKGTKLDAPVANMVSANTTSHETGNTHRNCKLIIDSGATDHIMHKASILQNRTKSVYKPPVIIPNGEKINVEGRRENTLESVTKIKGILHVPKLNSNLLFVSKICNDLQCAVTFFQTFYYAGLNLEDIDWSG